MDYKADGVATCDGCGGLTNNRCSSSGLIVCDDCKAGNPLTRPNPVPRFAYEDLEKELAQAKGYNERLEKDYKESLTLLYEARRERDELKAELAQAKEDCNEAIAIMTAAKRENARLAKEVADLRATVLQLTDLHTVSEGKVRELTKEVEESKSMACPECASLASVKNKLAAARETLEACLEYVQGVNADCPEGDDDDRDELVAKIKQALAAIGGESYWGADGRCVHCGAGNDSNHSFTCPTNLHPDKRTSVLR